MNFSRVQMEDIDSNLIVKSWHRRVHPRMYMEVATSVDSYISKLAELSQQSFHCRAFTADLSHLGEESSFLGVEY